MSTRDKGRHTFTNEPWLILAGIAMAATVVSWGYMDATASPHGKQDVWAVVFASVAMAAAILFGSLSFSLRITVNDEGIRLRYLISLGRDVNCRWRDIEGLELSDKMNARGESATDLHLRLKSGKVIKFSPTAIVGAERFIALVHELLEERSPSPDTDRSKLTNARS